MIVIEDKGTIKFFEDNKELSITKGFEKLDNIYHNEPLETKKIIRELKRRYLKNEVD